MSKLIATSLSALVLAFGITAAPAHEAGPGAMMPNNVGPSPQANQPNWTMPGAMPWAMMGNGRTVGQGWATHMMGFGMMGAGMTGPRMMIIMMDTNGDGALSLDEFQALHARMFAYLDANGDGKVTADELEAFHAAGDGDRDDN